MKTELLLSEIDNVFPDIPMPTTSDLTDHDKDYQLFEEDVCKYFDAYRHKKIEEDTLVRYMHKQLFILTPMAYRWLLPYYLKYCLRSDWRYAEDPVYFLVYSLSPSIELEHSTYIQLSELNAMQINCLLHFLEWCNENEDYYESEEDTDKAVIFLQKLLNNSNRI